jgi:sugar (pentulose or hexulose) kinase
MGVGLHDSSAALIPYLVSFQEPFVLISTGTWCISLNPFNQQPLTADELAQDCLCYLQYTGAPVKASRLFAGSFHDKEVQRIASHFNKPLEYFKTVSFDPAAVLSVSALADVNEPGDLTESFFAKRALSAFETAADAYHQLIFDLVRQQHISTQLVLKNSKVSRIFVDGGFGKNEIYMNMLAAAFKGIEVFAASVAQATAMGAALAIHEEWNTKPVPKNLIELKSYAPARIHQL